MAENVKQDCNDFSLDNIVTTALQIPGIKVNRNQLLADYFKNQNDVSVEELFLIEQQCHRLHHLLRAFRVGLRWQQQYPQICYSFLV